MEINNTIIEPGTNTTIELNVSKLPSGTVISLYAHVFRSKKPGPTILITGGVHGDEINGVEIVRRAVAQKLFNKLKCGTVITIPLVNLYGFNNFSRDLPDGKDVNRSFPGSHIGSLAARVASTITRHIIPIVDMGIDFHTGGSSIYNYPQIRANSEDAASIALANIFAPPLILESGLLAKSFRKECFKHNVPMVVFEGGESLRIDALSITEGINGIKRVLNHYQMTADEVPVQKPVTYQSQTWMRATASGIFVAQKQSGEWVKKGELMGYITDPYTSKIHKVTAKRDAFIFGHDNKSVVNVGKALFHICY
ncbi:succinylglutamate desuccinylase [Putridiphycobacter roseus]|uniref:Succinylglutamate desuccinylase n=1 Tax=Putridiphycobacter roseus TaxID=2219161 RepID=A0A2W1NUA8_9FLAO|nr:succinylglutamate desuccinylase/aspartoacylase family protein [Putridiphycobacter roseus]PZE18338.1 succinylglutamate desuccinylase [Putridiphycobacter roseus]